MFQVHLRNLYRYKFPRQTHYDILESLDKDSKGYKKAVKVRDSNISVMIDDLQTIDIDETTLQIISDSDYVSVR